MIKCFNGVASAISTSVRCQYFRLLKKRFSGFANAISASANCKYFHHHANMRVVNTTPHPLKLRTAYGWYVTVGINTDFLIRAKSVSTYVETVSGFNVRKTTYGQPVVPDALLDFLASQTDLHVVVTSMLALQALTQYNYVMPNAYVCSPGQLSRNTEGAVVGADGLSIL